MRPVGIGVVLYGALFGVEAILLLGWVEEAGVMPCVVFVVVLSS